MLTRWTLENFKPVRGKLELELSPLTVLAGLNSSGKSSFLQSVLLVAQTLSHQKLDEPLILNGSLVQLGTFEEVRNDRAHGEPIGIGFTFDEILLPEMLPRWYTPSTVEAARARSQITRRKRSVSISARFDNAREAEGEAPVRASLLSSEMVVDPGTDGRAASIHIRAAGAKEVGAALDDTLNNPRSAPIGLRYRYIATMSANGEPHETGLASTAHFIPNAYAIRVDWKRNAKDQFSTLIADATSSPSRRTDARAYFHQAFESWVKEPHETSLLRPEILARIEGLATDLSLPSFNGSSLDDIFDWILDLPAEIRQNESFGERLVDALVHDQPTFAFTFSRGANELWDRAAQGVIIAFMGAVRYLGPLRAEPRSVKGFAPSGEPDDVGARGEYAAAIYDANREQKIRHWNPIEERVEEATLQQAVDHWLGYLGVAVHVTTEVSPNGGASWTVQTSRASRGHPLYAVGVGVSQLLPVLVAGLLAPEGAILIFEQPELHLHERPQARLGDFFYGLTKVHKQVLVETHSAALVNQMRYRMVKGGQEARDAIAVYFVERDDQGDTRFDRIRVSRGGAIENWPDGFFDETLRQEDRITKEGILRRGGRAGA